MGLGFIDRELGKVKSSWVKKFYFNFFRHTLDSVYLRGGQILVTEAAIEDRLHCLSRTDATNAIEQAEMAIHCMTFDYDALRDVIATSDAPWVMDADNKKPKGMHFVHLSREARTWQEIFAHYIMPTTHFTEIPVDMLVLIGCVIEGKEVYFPPLIRRYMWQAHVRGILLFPTLVTEMIQLAGAPWEADDETPAPDHKKEEVIPWGTWVHEKPRSRCRSGARARAAAAPGPSSSTAAVGPSLPAVLLPPTAPQPTYLLVQFQFRFMEHSERRIMRRLDRVDQMFIAPGVELSPITDSPSSEKEEHEAEQA
ncbi:hypothetical protein Ahy_B10g103129 [Arachis hypogaea]|uniref:Putative plant transposon protein domain-containing protein n=1 Tax=Arachis hypogaea TaxID=3818 RepID=A0A444X3B8_ARAHY|nr:hypothetical protein Ahy_B10g103129 [Arachis hypogaea]